MSFASAARQVRDPGLSPWLRLNSLRGCVASFCWLTGLSYRATLDRLGLAWTPRPPADPPEEAFFRRTLDALERERNVYLAGLRGFELRRVRGKMRGNRQLSRAERDALSALRTFADEAVARVAAAARG